MDQVDLLIIGAGWNGLTMAKTYHEALPDAIIQIVDSASSVGGSWAAGRLYPGLRTNNILGSYEWSDFPMTPELSETSEGSHIPGAGVHKYMLAGVRHFGIERFLRLQTKVDSALLRDDNQWEVTCSSRDSQKIHRVVARCLVVATGLTSEPSMPFFDGQEVFQGLIIHSKELKAHAEALGSAKNVVVIGGNKSAWDVCYSVARSGGRAHMVVRRSGGGPSYTWPRQFQLLGFGTSLPTLTLTRFMTLFDPWPFGLRGVLLRFVKKVLHRTWLGMLITSTFWKLLNACVRSHNDYDLSTKTQKLLPWSSTFWMGNSLSTLNYPTDFFELVRRGQIVVHHAEVLSLDRHTACLADGTLADVDAVVCCTGWKAVPPLDFEPAEIRHSVGLPGFDSAADTILAEKAKRQIVQDLPELRTLPQFPHSKSDDKHSPPPSPYRLYRGMVPSDERFLQARNVAFIGMNFSLHTTTLAQVQALWITAFFSDHLPHLSQSHISFQQVHLDTIAFSEYEKLRRPRATGGSGEKFPDLVFDGLPYVDWLLDDIGLKSRRKSDIFQELFTPYGVKDYKGLVQEWKSLVYVNRKSSQGICSTDREDQGLTCN